PPNEGGTQDRIEDDDRARYDLDALPAGSMGGGRLHSREEDEQCPDQCGEADRDRNEGHPLTADVAGHQTVKSKLEECCHTDRWRGTEDEEEPPGGPFVELAEPSRHGDPQRERQHEEVADGKNDAFLIAPEANQPQEPWVQQALECFLHQKTVKL